MEIIEITCELLARQTKIERVGYVFQSLKSGKCFEGYASKISLCKLRDNEFTVDIDYLKSLNPKEWKNQDHYAVLGLGKLRFAASDDDIRRAYRKIVLQHHPDKRKAKGEKVKNDDDYFTCITKAYETLGTHKNRRAYDSVDPDFDDSLPSQTEIDKNYYETFNKYFNLNSRWSEKKNCPVFGDENSSRKDVDHFYSFWYDFKSWREFSYLDEEDKEKGQDRDERRWIEKENKTARIKRKKEEMLRIRSLVDLAYNNDKRIQKFKNEEKEKKLAIKRAKMDAAQALKAEQERVLKDAQLAKERAEKAEQKRIENIRIEKEQIKKALKKERKILRDKAKECNYFSSNDKDMLKNMEGIERICEMFNLTELQSLNKEMEKSEKDTFLIALKKADEKIQAELEDNKLIPKGDSKVQVKEITKRDIWDCETLQLLIKAVNLFPAGTAQRWDVIANFINQHSTSEYSLLPRDVLNKAKALQNSDFSKNALKTQANDDAFLSFEKKVKETRTNGNATVNSSENVIVNRENITTNTNNVQKSVKQSIISNNQNRTWTKEEQVLLEQAIKSFPITTPDRWDRIAECIPNRSKKDCLRRVKELVDLVNLKREAQQVK